MSGVPYNLATRPSDALHKDNSWSLMDMFIPRVHHCELRIRWESHLKTLTLLRNFMDFSKYMGAGSQGGLILKNYPANRKCSAGFPRDAVCLVMSSEPEWLRYKLGIFIWNRELMPQCATVPIEILVVACFFDRARSWRFQDDLACFRSLVEGMDPPIRLG